MGMITNSASWWARWFGDLRWGSLFLRVATAWAIGYFGAIQAGADKKVAGVAGVMAALTTIEAYIRNPKTLEWEEKKDVVAVPDNQP